MSLAKWLARAKTFAGENKAMLGAAAALPAGALAYHEGKPMLDDFMTDQAINSMKNSAKHALVDTVDYADKHPYMASAILGGAGATGAALGGDSFANIFDSLSPVKIGGILRSRQNQRGR